MVRVAGLCNVTLKGIARKIALVFIVLSTATWICHLVGFAVSDLGILAGSSQGSVTYPYFMTLIVFVVVLILAVAQAVTENRRGSQIVGAINTLFSVVYLTSLGMELFVTGTRILLVDNDFIMFNNYDAIVGVFAASLLNIVFWACLMMTSHFYKFGDD